MPIKRLTHFLFCLALAGAATAGEPGPVTIPTVHTAALNGDVVDLPASIKGGSAVLVVGFSQDSRVEVTEWGKRLADDFHDSPTVHYYEISMLGSVPKFLRGYVLRKIAATMPDLAKPHFLSIDEHEAEWRSVAGYRKPEDAYVLVVDGHGKVCWKAEGPATEAVYRQVKQHLPAIRTTP